MIKRLLTTIFVVILCAGELFAQNSTVTGVVTDDQGVVIGASVILKGTTTGTTTDANGKFTIKVNDPKTDVLVVRFVGNDEVTTSIKGRSYIPVRMTQSANDIESVSVSMGYGSRVKKGNVSSAVASVSGEVLAKVPVASAAEAMIGKMAGVQVTVADGSPDSEISIRVRGGTSITGDNSPLYIVDGFPIENLNNIAPTDIEDITVLKDAASTAIYGARGANGVVVVTTKQAKAGVTTVDVQSSLAFSKLGRTLDLMDPYEFVMIQYEAARIGSSNPTGFINTFGDPRDLYIYKGYKGRNYLKEAMAGSPTTQTNTIAVTGGSAKTKFKMNFESLDLKSIVLSNNQNRLNFGVKLNHEIAKGLNMDFQSRYTKNTVGGASTGGARETGGVSLRAATRYRPTDGLTDFMSVPAVDDEGNEIDDPEDPNYEDKYSPQQQASRTFKSSEALILNLMGGLSWNITKSLIFRTEYGIDKYDTETQRWDHGATVNAQTMSNGKPMTQQTFDLRDKYRLANTLTYYKTINKSNIRAMAGQEIVSSEKSSKFYQTTEFPDDISPEKAFDNLALGVANLNKSFVDTPERTESFFGTVSYDWDSRYYITATFRTDGSSRFAPGNQWGYFPAAAVSWDINKESWMKQFTKLSNLKLRFSLGSAGNNQIASDAWRPLFQLGNSTSRGPAWYGPKSSFYEPADSKYLTNPSLRWETSFTENLGLDFGFFKQRLSGTIDIYNNITKDLLVPNTIPSTTGYTKQQTNIGQTSSRGIELTLNAQIIRSTDFNLFTSFNVGYNRNRIDKLASGEKVWELASNWSGSSDIINYNDYRLTVGETMGQIYGYVYDGFYQVDDFEDYRASGNKWVLKKGVADCTNISGAPRPGNLRVKKLIPVDENAANPYLVDSKLDVKKIGDTNPIASGGLNINGNWKNFDFTLFFNYMLGFDVYNATKMSLSSWTRNSNNNLLANMGTQYRFRYTDDQGNFLLDNPEALRELNKNATIYNPISLGKQLAMDYIVEDGSFLRLNNIVVGYTLPNKISTKAGLKRLRVYGTIYNLFILTKYSGFDPEINVQKAYPGGDIGTYGVDYNTYPKSRNFTVGIQGTF